MSDKKSLYAKIIELEKELKDCEDDKQSYKNAFEKLTFMNTELVQKYKYLEEVALANKKIESYIIEFNKKIVKLKELFDTINNLHIAPIIIK